MSNEHSGYSLPLLYFSVCVRVSQTEKNIMGITKIFNILKLGFMNFKIAYGKALITDSLGESFVLHNDYVTGLLTPFVLVAHLHLRNFYMMLCMSICKLVR